MDPTVEVRVNKTNVASGEIILISGEWNHAGTTPIGAMSCYQSIPTWHNIFNVRNPANIDTFEYNPNNQDTFGLQWTAPEVSETTEGYFYAVIRSGVTIIATAIAYITVRPPTTTCTQYYSAEDQNGNALWFIAYFDLYRKINGVWSYNSTHGCPANGLPGSVVLKQGEEYQARCEDYDGYTTPPDQTRTACIGDFTLVYTKIATTCTQAFTAKSSVGELPFTPGVLIFAGNRIALNKLVGIWDLPANIPNLTIGSTYLAYPRIPSSYTGDDFTTPQALVFTACTSTINFVYAKQTQGGVYTVLQPVVSSNIEAVGWIMYAPNLPLLEVAFIGGSLYLYTGVPESVFNGLMAAASKGGYFWDYIRCKTRDCSGGDIPYPYSRLR